MGQGVMRCSLFVLVLAIVISSPRTAMGKSELVYQGMVSVLVSSSTQAVDGCDRAGHRFFKKFTNDPQICNSYANLQWGAFPESPGPGMINCNVVVYGQPLPKEGTFAPTFIVQSIQYALPGAKSRVIYSGGSGRTSTFTTTFSVDNELTLKWDWGMFEFGSKLAAGYSKTGKITTTTSSEGSIEIDAEGDVADHWRDLFTLWINPVLNKRSLCDGAQGSGSEYWVGATFEPWVIPGLDPNEPQLVQFSAAELLGRSPPSTEQKRLFLSQLSRSEIVSNIIALNPFFDNNGDLKLYPVLDRDRFRPIAVNGASACERSFAGINSGNRRDCRADYSFAEDDETTYNVNWSVNAGLTFGKGREVSDALTIKYSRADNESGTLSTSAAIHLESSSPQICIDGQMKVDTMFNNIIILSSTHPCP